MSDEHTVDDDPKSHLRSFFLPELNKRFMIRFAIVAGSAYIIFGHILLPARAAGASMEPTYMNGELLFCSRLRYWRKPPQVGDVVRMAAAIIW